MQRGGMVQPNMVQPNMAQAHAYSAAAAAAAAMAPPMYGQHQATNPAAVASTPPQQMPQQPPQQPHSLAGRGLGVGADVASVATPKVEEGMGHGRVDLRTQMGHGHGTNPPTALSALQTPKPP